MLAPVSAKPRPWIESSGTTAPLPPRVTESIDEVDPYEGWQHWCEPHVAPCATTADCRRVKHPSGKPLKCIRPYYAKNPDDKVCSPGWSTRGERAHQRARIRELVRLQYSGESTCTGGGWRCSQRRARGDRLATFLSMVAQRETTMRPWKRHRLNADVRANRKSFERTDKFYKGNRHRRARWRWEYGVGLFGANASLFTRVWASDAPPEILCREVPGVETYLRSARKGWRSLKGGVDCDGEPGREWHGFNGSPTVYDGHRWASGGKLCPSPVRTKFEKRAAKWGVDPYRPVSLRDLGAPIERDEQNKRAVELEGQLALFSMAWFVQG